MVRYVNNTLTILFWQIGNRINNEILKNKRAEYAKQIVSTLSTQLKAQYGKNFEIRNLRRMMQFAEQFTDIEVILPFLFVGNNCFFVHFFAMFTVNEQSEKMNSFKIAYN